jgi:putative ABC transport system permease protein
MSYAKSNGKSLGIFRYAWRALLRSPRRTLSSIFGIFLAIGLLSSVLFFVGASARTMTQRTIASVPVDMRVQALTYDLDMAQVQAVLRRQPGIVDARLLTMSHFSGSRFVAGDKTYTTGPGAIIALDEAYLRSFPAIRLVQGQLGPSGVVISQDMGTNLGVHMGDIITLTLPGTGPDYQARVIGIANMSRADSLFAPTDPRLQGVAFNPPANVIILPMSVFDAELAARLRNAPPPPQPITTGGPGVVVQTDVLSVDRQIHLKINRSILAGDPTQAQMQTTLLRRELEKLYPGRVRVSDELFAAIETVKDDVLWAQVLFVFLAIPAIVLAAYLSRYASETMVTNQSQEFALLRARGATQKQILGIVAMMSLCIALLGAALGVMAGILVIIALFGPNSFALGNWRMWGSTISICVLAGILIGTVSTFLPARNLISEEVVSGRRRAKREESRPLWARLYLDVAALTAAGIVFWITQVNGFHPVLNAEGNPTLSLSFYTFLAPLLFWLGSTFLLLRIATLMLRRSASLLGGLLRLPFGEVGRYAASTSARRAHVMSQAAVVVALALSFGCSISIFASTYAHQQRVDAELTLGSDVKVTPRSGHEMVSTYNTTLARQPGVAASTPFKMTVAYVGTEIQDIFGIDVPTFRRSTNLSDSFFQGGTADEMMNRLATTPDGILISDEMARDYSIVTGDHVNLRLYNRVSNTYKDARFTVAGVALEFPTAPRDAFLVVNLPALVRATGDSSVSFFLLKTSDDPANVAHTVQSRLGSDAVQTQSIGSVADKLATSLTSLNLSGLVAVEYVYTILIASAGLAVFLVALLGERRREFATMRAVGALGRQLGAFVVYEAGLIGLSGLVLGGMIGTGLAAMLVLILAHIFDPPPSGPIPDYVPLAVLAALTLAGLVLTISLALWRLGHMRVGDTLREQ